jgi:hypothetical protein
MNRIKTVSLSYIEGDFPGSKSFHIHLNQLPVPVCLFSDLSRLYYRLAFLGYAIILFRPRGCQKFLLNEDTTLSKISLIKYFYSIMKSSTSTPQNAKSKDADIIRKTRFLHAIDTRPNHVFVKNICEQEDIKSDRDKY